LILFLKRANLKIITELHGIFIFHHDGKWKIQELPYNLPDFIVKIFIKIFFKMIGKLSDKIIIHTKSGKIGLRDYFGIKDRKILVLPLAISKNIEPNPQKFKDMELLFKNRKIILSFGNISSRKGLEYAIKALNLIKNELPNHCLVIAGRSVREYQNYENMLHELVEKLQLQEKIIFMGFLDEDELNSLFKISEIVLYPYLPSSAASIGIIHSMYHQKPIIVSNIDTFNEIFKKNEAVFVEPKNEREIANAIILLANDPILRKSLQEKMEKISIDYSWEKIADRLIGLYEEIYSKTKTL